MCCNLIKFQIHALSTSGVLSDKIIEIVLIRNKINTSLKYAKIRKTTSTFGC